MAEDNWTAQALTAYNQAFKDAATLGVSVLAAAGDDGSNDNMNDGKAHVDFPAASPWVTGCGGTRLDGTDTHISGEAVWHEASGGATGGGVSRKFGLPNYQAGAHVPKQADDHKHVGRGVPDIAADADPETGYQVRVDGHDMIIGGTSAVAPLWSGLLALVNQHRGTPAGFVNPKLYKHGPFRDITQGDNGAYHAGTGWDACTGLGSPNAEVVTALA
jgi:kumamolisin